MFSFILVLGAMVFDPNQLLALFAPLITWLAVFAVNKVKAALGTSGFGGTVLITMVVPIVGFIASIITDYLLNPGLTFWIIFVLSFVGVFLSEFIKQWVKTIRGVQEPVVTTLTRLPKVEK